MVEACRAGRHGVAGLDCVQTGSSPRTSLLHPSFAQPWGELSQTLPRVGLWTAPGKESQRGNLAQGPCLEVLEKWPPL